MGNTCKSMLTHVNVCQKPLQYCKVISLQLIKINEKLKKIFFWLIPCPRYYKQCCDEHWGTHVSFSFGFLGVYAQEWDCWVIWQFYFQFFKESPKCSP